MSSSSSHGVIPSRLAFAGGWIDQPFVSKLNPTPPGSMVVVNIHPTFDIWDRAGLATGTRKVAQRIWPNGLPNRPLADLVKELYAEENKNSPEPSGSQDMIGLLYPGINRLDYEFSHQGGVFPSHIESNNDPKNAHWLESVIKIIPVAPRPEGYNPLGIKNLNVKVIQELGQTGKDCYNAILANNLAALGDSFNRCMTCWASLMPHIVSHPTLKHDLVGILKSYQSKYPGAMYSGCGGGYLFVASDKPIENSIPFKVRTA